MREKIIPYLQTLLDEELPFLAFKKAGQDELQIISQKDSKWYKSSHDNLSYVVFSKFYDNDNQVYILNEVYKSFMWDGKEISNLKTFSDIPSDGKNQYLNLFQKAQIKLNNKELKKVVLSRKQDFEKKKSDLEIFENLLDTYPSANCYFFSHPKVGKWMGATPELLLEVSKELTHQAYSKDITVPVKVYTMSLAGTAVHDGKDTHIWGDKELEEQRLVTDFIKSQFVKTGITNIKESELETIEAGHLLHLRTLLAGTTHSGNIEELINSLHPTPAVCGLPRDKSKEFIIGNENYDRSYYTGYLGIVHKDSSDYFVNLRCMQLFDKKASIYVGGGVTAKSDGNLEYAETQEKLKTMLRLL